MKNIKKIFMTALVLLASQIGRAQINALTEKGDPVVLYKDGTWKYVNDSLVEKSEIPVNSKKFAKDKEASFLVKSSRVNIGIWLNPKVWSFTKETGSDDAEFDFTLKGGDLYGRLIAEKVSIPIETLRDIALENAKEAAPDARVVKEEYRTVNGVKVLLMQMAGTLK